MAPFPEGSEAHFETANLEVWNSQEGSAEHQELIYEVSWIEELGMWRGFLKSRRKVAC
ncbi:MAG TPA: hypothetical protein VLV88_03950 [Terriglobales bacterium]|nr:hypothetical protein [Terriglobales bacterium]